MADAAINMNIALTYEDYLTFPDDGRRYEILEGEMTMTPAPSTRHQDVSRNLALILAPHVKSNLLGKVYYAPVDVILSDISVVQPDLIFIAAENLSRISQRGIEGAPDLIVEILSPGTLRTDRTRKLKLYAQYGVKWYWIVSPDDTTIEEYHLSESGYVLHASASGETAFAPALFAGLSIDLAEVWE